MTGLIFAIVSLAVATLLATTEALTPFNPGYVSLIPVDLTPGRGVGELYDGSYAQFNLSTCLDTTSPYDLPEFVDSFVNAACVAGFPKETYQWFGRDVNVEDIYVNINGLLSIGAPYDTDGYAADFPMCEPFTPVVPQEGGMCKDINFVANYTYGPQNSTYGTAGRANLEALIAPFWNHLTLESGVGGTVGSNASIFVDHVFHGDDKAIDHALDQLLRKYLAAAEGLRYGQTYESALVVTFVDVGGNDNCHLADFDEDSTSEDIAHRTARTNSRLGFNTFQVVLMKAFVVPEEDAVAEEGTFLMYLYPDDGLEFISLDDFAAGEPTDCPCHNDDTGIGFWDRVTENYINIDADPELLTQYATPHRCTTDVCRPSWVPDCAVNDCVDEPWALVSKDFSGIDPNFNISYDLYRRSGMPADVDEEVHEEEPPREPWRRRHHPYSHLHDPNYSPQVYANGDYYNDYYSPEMYGEGRDYYTQVDMDGTNLNHVASPGHHSIVEPEVPTGANRLPYNEEYQKGHFVYPRSYVPAGAHIFRVSGRRVGPLPNAIEPPENFFDFGIEEGDLRLKFSGQLSNNITENISGDSANDLWWYQYNINGDRPENDGYGPIQDGLPLPHHVDILGKMIDTVFVNVDGIVSFGGPYPQNPNPLPMPIAGNFGGLLNERQVEVAQQATPLIAMFWNNLRAEPNVNNTAIFAGLRLANDTATAAFTKEIDDVINRAIDDQGVEPDGRPFASSFHFVVTYYKMFTESRDGTVDREFGVSFQLAIATDCNGYETYAVLNYAVDTSQNARAGVNETVDESKNTYPGMDWEVSPTCDLMRARRNVHYYEAFTGNDTAMPSDASYVRGNLILGDCVGLTSVVGFDAGISADGEGPSADGSRIYGFGEDSGSIVDHQDILRELAERGFGAININPLSSEGDIQVPAVFGRNATLSESLARTSTGSNVTGRHVFKIGGFSDVRNVTQVAGCDWGVPPPSPTPAPTPVPSPTPSTGPLPTPSSPPTPEGNAPTPGPFVGLPTPTNPPGGKPLTGPEPFNDTTCAGCWQYYTFKAPIGTRCVRGHVVVTSGDPDLYQSQYRNPTLILHGARSVGNFPEHDTEMCLSCSGEQQATDWVFGVYGVTEAVYTISVSATPCPAPTPAPTTAQPTLAPPIVPSSAPVASFAAALVAALL